MSFWHLRTDRPWSISNCTSWMPNFSLRNFCLCALLQLLISNWSVFLFSFELQDYTERGVDRIRQVEDDVNYDNVQMDMSEVST